MRSSAAALAPPTLSDLGYLAPYALTATILLGTTGLFWTPFLGPVVGFGLLPLADFAIGRSDARRGPAEAARAAGSLYFRLLLWLWVPTQLGLMALGAARLAGPAPDFMLVLGITLATGISSGGIGITVAHELGHKRARIDWLCARILFLSVGYLHFLIEHNEGHHVRVGTRDDPATARLGEGFWRFLVRSVAGQYHHAWLIERERLERAGAPFFSARNQMLWFTGLPLLLALAFAAVLGPLGLVFFVGQALVAIGLLEAVNYVEHYGLERRELAPGRHEPVGPQHSWDASFKLTNWVLFGLQRHADHHARAGVRYQNLVRRDEAPELPAGYPFMILLALVPPAWRFVMDARVHAHRARTRDAAPGAGQVALG